LFGSNMAERSENMIPAGQVTNDGDLCKKENSTVQSFFPDRVIHRKEEQQITLFSKKEAAPQKKKKKKNEKIVETKFQEWMERRHEIFEQMKGKYFFKIDYEDPSRLLASIEASQDWRPEKIMEKIYLPFKRHNVDDRQMRKLAHELGEVIGKERIIIPKELLSLALLNRIDEYLACPHHSNHYFKTSNTMDDFSLGRRSAGMRHLTTLGYIVRHGNQWKRTEKEFDETDFWMEK